MLYSPEKNYPEIEHISENIKDFLIKNNIGVSLPPIRFKFAHGPTNSDFLCSQAQLKQIWHSLPQESWCNTKYLHSMLDRGYFDFAGIAAGMPLKNKIGEMSSFTCHAIRLTCKIDAFGDVYPCCFLFDDNNSGSTFRDAYKIGSLRSDQTLTVTSPNKLKEIWYQKNGRFERLRNDPLPVNDKACGYCTRHFYQNEFLNKFSELLKKYEYSDQVANELAADNPNDFFWV